MRIARLRRRSECASGSLRYTVCVKQIDGGAPESTKATAPSRRRRKSIFAFTLKGLEELDHFPSAEAREEALRDVEKSIRWWEVFFGIVVIAGAVISVNIFVRWALDWMIPTMDPTAREILDTLRILVMIAIGFLVMRALHRWGMARDLRKRLIACGVPVCEGCGYVLRGLPPEVKKCPECGAEIEENVRGMIRIDD